MADFSELKTKKAAKKGVPPTPKITNGNLDMEPREKPVKKRKIEFSVPENILRDFERAAMDKFGFKKGSKSNLFIEIWNEYTRTNQ